MRKNWLEWLAVGAGSLLLLVVSSYLVYQQLSGGHEHPELSAAIEFSKPNGDWVEYQIAVKNEGFSAEKVRVELCDEADQCRDYEFRYVPARASKRAVIALENPEGIVIPHVVAWSSM